MIWPSRKRVWLVCGVLLAVVSANAWAGFFRVVEENGAWWFLDNKGEKFLSKGVDCVGPGTSPKNFDEKNPGYCALKFYPSHEKWANASADRFERWGFNTIGGHSSRVALKARRLPYTIALWLGTTPGTPWGDIRDAGVLREIKRMTARLADYRNDELLIGYFTDNELGWWDETVLTHWLAQAWEERLKRVVWDMAIHEYHGDVRRFLRDFAVKPVPGSFDDLKGKLEDISYLPGRRPLLVERFLEFIADEYYRTAAAAVREVDPNHLIMGDRYASFYSQPILRAASRHVDVVSTNYNTFAQSGWVMPAFFETMHRITHKPILVTEYYFSAEENRTGNKNENGPFMVVKTQEQRAAGAREMTERLARLPYVVGYHWFQYTDEPRLGRGDGEDFNFGLVDIWDKPYEGLVKGFTEANGRAHELHGQGLKDAGLSRKAEMWEVPRAPGTVVLDGKTLDWDLAGTWVPTSQAKQPFLRFGDFHVAWEPEGLLVCAVFFDYAADKTEGSDLSSRQRLSLAVSSEIGRTVRVNIVGFEKGEPGDDGIRQLAAVTDSGQTATGVKAAWWSTSLTRVVEVRVPASVLGKRSLSADEKLSLALSVRLRGDVKETFWPVPLSGTGPERAELASLRLAERIHE